MIITDHKECNEILKYIETIPSINYRIKFSALFELYLNHTGNLLLSERTYTKNGKAESYISRLDKIIRKCMNGHDLTQPEMKFCNAVYALCQRFETDH